MMILAPRRRGEPLIALALILAGWVGVRAAVWDRAIHHEVEAEARAQAQAGGLASARQSEAAGGRAPARDAGLPARAGRAAAVTAPRFDLLAPPPAALLQPAIRPWLPSETVPESAPLAPATAAPESAAPSPARQRIAAAGGHAMLWLAATALLPLPPQGLAARRAARANDAPLPRWSGDSWLLVRRGGGAVTPTTLAGTYGASQAGAVIRYRIDREDRHRPTAYLRATSALATREQEVAVGLSARPIAGFPVVAMAEGRVLRGERGVRVRPAAALVSEFPPQTLPLGFDGEVYVQAGYIGGRFATGFIDGLVRAERPIAGVAGFDLRAGAGAWGAKQRGGQRFDVGPVASVRIKLGDAASARLEADWRFRVAGKSLPGSGPAITLSAGF